VAVSRPCLGEQLTALVDGALSHADRERVHAHLAGCAGCRAEVEEQRRLKARLAALAAAPEPPGRLVASLRALAVPGTDPLARPLAGRPGPLGAPGLRGDSGPRGERPGGAPRPAARPGRTALQRARRGTAVGGGVVALGVAAALLLGGPGAAPASTPVDPGSDAFVVDFVSTTSGIPLAEPAGAAVPLPNR
jgi:anti-sigma factor RsiW